MQNIREKIEKIREIIQKDALVFKHQQKFVGLRGEESSWIFDMRNILLKPEPLDLISDVFWHFFEKEYPFQVGGQETAAIPLISAIVLKSLRIGKPVNGFFIRKHRKPIGLQKMIEGKITNEKIILVDDLINTGSTVFRQAKILGAINKKIDTYFSLVNFQEESNIQRLKEKNIKLVSPFSLSDFGLKYARKEKNNLEEDFKVVWKFESPNPSIHNRDPKSTPCIDEKNIYFGNDSGYFWALSQNDGTIIWKFKVGYGFWGKYIYSSPSIYEDCIYFGACDGNVYALKKETGKLKWKNLDADYIASSPAIAKDLGLLFIGCQYGISNEKGGILALDLLNGKKIWEQKISAPVESSPAYCQEKNMVAIGANDGLIYMFDSKNGKLKWKFKTGGPIKASFCFNLEKNTILFGSYDKYLYSLDIDSGKIKGRFETMDIIYSTPEIQGKNALFTSLDGNLYSLDLETGKLNWRVEVGGRIFSSPKIYESNVYFGSTDGKMYEIGPENKKKSRFETLERITDNIVYNPETKRFFVATYANELYCLKKDTR
jgi:orotate phosphoribosyltransferase